MTKTVLELDLVGYSTIAATLEEGLSVETSPKLNQQIQTFIDVGLQAAGVSRESTVMQTTGDGAILVFDRPSPAHVFADAVQQATRKHNATKVQGIGKRVFRIGIATGDLVMEPKANGGFDIAGMTIARAVRLEAKAKPGEVLCDPDTFRSLSAKQRKVYSAAETIVGKRDEKFKAHRCLLNPDGVKDAEFFTGDTNQSKSPTGKVSKTPRITNSELTPLQQLRVEAVGILKDNPSAVEILAKQLAVYSKLPLDSAEHLARYEQVVNALVKVDVAVAVKVLVLGYLDASNDQRGGPTSAPARTIEQLCYTMLPVIYEPEEFSRVRFEIQHGGALISLPVTYKTTVDIIMAGVDGRPVRLLAPTNSKTLPFAKLHLHNAPEMGFDTQSDHFVNAFRNYLVARFVPAGGQSQTPEKLNDSISVKLKNAIEIDKDRFYYIYEVPRESNVEQRRQDQVTKLKREFPMIAFVGLESAKDSAHELNVLDLFLRLLCKAAGVEWSS